MIAIREIATELSNVAPSGVCSGFVPNAIVPTIHAAIGINKIAKADRVRLTLIF
jgi:hypothetical protein